MSEVGRAYGKYTSRKHSKMEQNIEYDYSNYKVIEEILIPAMEVELNEYQEEMDRFGLKMKEGWWSDKECRDDPLAVRRMTANTCMRSAIVKQAGAVKELIKYWKRRLVSPLDSTLAPEVRNYIRVNYDVAAGKTKSDNKERLQVEKELGVWASSLGIGDGLYISEIMREWNEL